MGSFSLEIYDCIYNFTSGVYAVMDDQIRDQVFEEKWLGAPYYFIHPYLWGDYKGNNLTK